MPGPVPAIVSLIGRSFGPVLIFSRSFMVHLGSLLLRTVIANSSEPLSLPNVPGALLRS